MRLYFGFTAASTVASFLTQASFVVSQSRRRGHGGTRACRIVCAWATSRRFDAAPPSPSSGPTEPPFRISSSQRARARRRRTPVWRMGRSFVADVMWALFQATRAHQLAARGHREAAEAAGEKKAAPRGSHAATQRGAQQTKGEEQRPGE